jgi:hypothetical protein
VTTARLREARQEALRLLRRFGLDTDYPVPVEDVAHALGVGIVSGELERALACLTRVGGHARIRVSDRHVDPGQLRFSIAHELGHYLLGHGAGLRGCDLETVQRVLVDSQAEAEANTFAGELLLPEPLVRERCRTAPVDFDAIEKIAADFAVSVVAAAIRFAELTSRACALLYEEHGEVRWVVMSRSLALGFGGGGRKVFGRGTSLSRLTSRASDNNAGTCWAYRQGTLCEQTRRLDYVDGSLALLWLPGSASTSQVLEDEIIERSQVAE